jgi:peptide/nickel transport system permease protein
MTARAGATGDAGAQRSGVPPPRRGTGGYLLGRLAEYGIVFAVALLINFALPRALPGGPLQSLGGQNVGLLSAADRAKIQEQYGLDRPLGEQFVDYLGGVFTLDLGDSFSDEQPVTEAIGNAFPWTLLLVGSSLVLMSALGVALGVVGALRRRRGKGSVLLSIVMLFDSTPSFWLGMLLITFFGVYLGVLPTFGATALEGGLSIDHLVLPVATLTLVGFGQFFLMTRSSLLTVLTSEPVEHARARGVPRGRLIWRHALRPALLPAHTVLLTEIGFLMGGTIVVETVFAYPGLGRLTFGAIQGRDYPLMQGAFLMLTMTMLLMNALADATYSLLDPRIRREGRT